MNAFLVKSSRVVQQVIILSINFLSILQILIDISFSYFFFIIFFLLLFWLVFSLRFGIPRHRRRIEATWYTSRFANTVRSFFLNFFFLQFHFRFIHSSNKKVRSIALMTRSQSRKRSKSTTKKKEHTVCFNCPLDSDTLICILDPPNF